MLNLLGKKSRRGNIGVEYFGRRIIEIVYLALVVVYAYTHLH